MSKGDISKMAASKIATNVLKCSNGHPLKRFDDHRIAQRKAWDLEDGATASCALCCVTGENVDMMVCWQYDECKWGVCQECSDKRVKEEIQKMQKCEEELKEKKNKLAEEAARKKEQQLARRQAAGKKEESKKGKDEKEGDKGKKEERKKGKDEKEGDEGKKDAVKRKREGDEGVKASVKVKEEEVKGGAKRRREDDAVSNAVQLLLGNAAAAEVPQFSEEEVEQAVRAGWETMPEDLTRQQLCHRTAVGLFGMGDPSAAAMADAGFKSAVRAAIVKLEAEDAEEDAAAAPKPAAAAAAAADAPSLEDTPSSGRDMAAAARLPDTPLDTPEAPAAAAAPLSPP